jgi:hypothetical protein
MDMKAAIYGSEDAMIPHRERAGNIVHYGRGKTKTLIH